MSRNCQKGKPCGATCIERLDNCLKDLANNVSSSVPLARSSIIKSKSEPYTLSPSAKAKSYGDDSIAQKTARDILSDLQSEGKAKERSINWRVVLGSGASYVGGGGYGSYVRISSNDLLRGKVPGVGNRVGVKTGRIGPNEVAAIKIAGNNGLGPSLIGARVSSRVDRDRYGNSFSNGAIAMTHLGGISYQKAPEQWGVYGSKSDLYWVAAAKLHRLGIAHNDMHGGNIFLSFDGKARFVDFGLAQVNPKAALAEALGSLSGTNWQFKASTSEGYAQYAQGNLGSVKYLLSEKGLSPRGNKGSFEHRH